MTPFDETAPAPISARELFTSFDWSRTPLGPVSGWPARLRTMAEVVLANRYPMIVLWSSELVHAVYNDSYARLIGRRHPGALGERNEQYWPEVWHINGPIFDAVLAEGREFYFEDALYPLERHTWREEVYLTISYAPVRDDDDRIAGVLVTMIETTRNVLAERRLRTLREVATRTARLRSSAEISAIAVNALAENTGDVVFAAIVEPDTAGGLNVRGHAGISGAEALGIGRFALAAAGGLARAQIALPAEVGRFTGGALSEPVRRAYVAALPGAGGSASSRALVIGLSSSVPHDERYREFLELIDAQLSAAFENATVFTRERRIADTLQRAALPGTLPGFPGVTVDAVYEAGSDEAQIGGDWYDAFALRDGRIVVSIGDVAGSGVEAAAAMGAARQMIRALAQTLDNPVEILDAVDRAFRVEDGATLVTAIVGFLGAGRRELVYASAGHPPGLLRRPDGAVEVLSGGDLPIGVRDGSAAAPVTLPLDAGSVVVLYTDGLTEATRDPLEGERRLISALSAPEFAGQARKALFLYERVLERRTHDDVALLVMELNAAAPA